MAGDIYQQAVADTQLRQGEILSSVTQLVFDREANELQEVEHAFCLVGSQECDLARDWEVKGQAQSVLDGVLLFVADPAASVRADIGGRDIWKRVIQNKDERYQALEAVSAEDDLEGAGLDALIVDFRRYFTVSSPDLYSQIEVLQVARRRSCIRSPFREHVQNRAAAFLSRVALERDHDVPMNPVAPAAAPDLEAAPAAAPEPQPAAAPEPQPGEAPDAPAA